MQYKVTAIAANALKGNKKVTKATIKCPAKKLKKYRKMLKKAKLQRWCRLSKVFHRLIEKRGRTFPSAYENSSV